MLRLFSVGFHFVTHMFFSSSIVQGFLPTTHNHSGTVQIAVGMRQRVAQPAPLAERLRAERMVLRLF